MLSEGYGYIPSRPMVAGVGGMYPVFVGAICENVTEFKI
jgi:hypothetical protein